MTADRGYGEAAVDQALTDLGVRTVVIPRKGRPGAARQQVEKRRAFRRTIKWRTGCEGRISTLKRGYGWDRTRLDSLEGAKTWTGQGVFTHNLTKNRRPDRLKSDNGKIDDHQRSTRSATSSATDRAIRVFQVEVTRIGTTGGRTIVRSTRSGRGMVRSTPVLAG